MLRFELFFEGEERGPGAGPNKENGGLTGAAGGLGDFFVLALLMSLFALPFPDRLGGVRFFMARAGAGAPGEDFLETGVAFLALEGEVVIA